MNYCSHCGNPTQENNTLCNICRSKATKCAKCAHVKICKIAEACGKEYVYACQFYLNDGIRLPDDFEYMCPECGELINVWHNMEDESDPAIRNIIRHCEKCGSDWANQWENGVETPLKKKIWG